MKKRCLLMSRTIARVLPLFAISFLGCRDVAAPPQPVHSSDTPNSSVVVADTGKSQHSFGDFSFTIPSGWKVVAPDRDKTKAMILLDGTTVQNAKAMIKVDVGNPTAPSAEALAQGFAKSAGGTVSPEPLDFDGTQGINASTSSSEMTTPRNLIVILRGNRVYLLMVGAVEGVDVAAPIAAIRKSWSWTK
jgi:uncharacterized protein YbdZ (MbtH family)